MNMRLCIVVQEVNSKSQRPAADSTPLHATPHHSTITQSLCRNLSCCYVFLLHEECVVAAMHSRFVRAIRFLVRVAVETGLLRYVAAATAATATPQHR